MKSEKSNLIDMNKSDLKKLSKSQLIKLLLEPMKISIMPDIIIHRELCLSKHLNTIKSNLKKRTKSELVKLLLEKNKPKIEINSNERTFKIHEHLTDKIKLTYEGDLIIYNPDSNFSFICEETIFAQE